MASFQVAVSSIVGFRVPDGPFHQVDAESVIPSKWLPLRLQDVGLPRVDFFDWKMMDASLLTFDLKMYSMEDDSHASILNHVTGR